VLPSAVSSVQTSLAEERGIDREVDGFAVRHSEPHAERAQRLGEGLEVRSKTSYESSRFAIPIVSSSPQAWTTRCSGCLAEARYRRGF
jgi:hypothetical protein